MNIPPGFATVTPYLFIKGAAEYITFLETAFAACEVGRSAGPDGRIANCQMRFDTAMMMLSESSADFPASCAAFYLYVADADASMERAVRAGAIKIMDVADMPYGDRQGGVRDRAGNIWWVSERLAAGAYF